ncbi:hypothetical protein CB013_010800 [Salmonella bongori]|nr:hypothetical protein [Salmonella bongori]
MSAEQYCRKNIALYVLYMPADGSFNFTVQFAEHSLREPQRIAFKTTFNTHFPVTTGKHKKFACRGVKYLSVMLPPLASDLQRCNPLNIPVYVVRFRNGLRSDGDEAKRQVTSNREWQRLFNPFQFLLRFLLSAKQLLLLVVPGHQDNAPVHHFYANLSNPASCSLFPDSVRLGVLLSLLCGRYPIRNERSVLAIGKSEVECELAIINSLIVGEVSSRPVLRVPDKGVSNSGYCVKGRS